MSSPRPITCPTCETPLTRADLTIWVSCTVGHRVIAGTLIPSLDSDEHMRLMDATGRLHKFDRSRGLGTLVAAR